MAYLIGVMGDSGSGKTTSMRNLNPKSTFYIDCDLKGLSWRGWRDNYNAANKNYIQSSDKEMVLKCLGKIATDETYKHIETIVIDTMNGIMVDDEMARMKEKTYDKWADLAQAVYGIISFALKMPSRLNVICIFHAQIETNDSGVMYTRIKTNGKKLDKIQLETKFPCVLYAKCVDGQHIFEVHSNNSTAKTPMGAFDENTVPNDMAEVLKRLEEFK